MQEIMMNKIIAISKKLEKNYGWLDIQALSAAERQARPPGARRGPRGSRAFHAPLAEKASASAATAGKGPDGALFV
jgi:hypothetical protein